MRKTEHFAVDSIHQSLLTTWDSRSVRTKRLPRPEYLPLFQLLIDFLLSSITANNVAWKRKGGCGGGIKGCCLPTSFLIVARTWRSCHRRPCSGVAKKPLSHVR